MYYYFKVLFIIIFDLIRTWRRNKEIDVGMYVPTYNFQHWHRGSEF